MTGTLLLDKTFAHVLFDSGASHSFVTFEFAKKFSRDPCEMDHVSCTTKPGGSALKANVIYIEIVFLMLVERIF